MARSSGPVVYDGWFNWKVPHGWELENDDDGLLTVHSDAGAFHVSCFDRSSPVPPSEKEAAQAALRFAAAQGWPVAKGDVRARTVDGSPCAEFETDDGGKQPEHWHAWHVIGATRVVLLTYVCPAAKKDVERAEREAMVASFEWEPLDDDAMA